MLLLVCYGEGHTALILLRGHVLTQHTRRPIPSAGTLERLLCFMSSRQLL
jgi:hypothetical protein